MLLKTWLKRSKLTQEEFGARVGADQSTVSNWLTGRKVPGAQRLLAILKVTDGKVSPKELLTPRGKSAPRKRKPFAR